jgi:hypothetical protein
MEAIALSWRILREQLDLPRVSNKGALRRHAITNAPLDWLLVNN